MQHIEEEKNEGLYDIEPQLIVAQLPPEEKQQENSVPAGIAILPANHEDFSRIKTLETAFIPAQTDGDETENGATKATGGGGRHAQTSSQEEQLKLRRFEYHISDLAAEFEVAIEDPFFCFEVGGILKELETGRQIASTLRHTKKMEEAVESQLADGKDLKKEAEDRELEEMKRGEGGKEDEGGEDGDDDDESSAATKKKKKVEVDLISARDAEVVTPVFVHYTQAHELIFAKEKGKQILYHREFSGTWHNSYANLSNEFLRIKLWSRKYWGLNDLIGDYAWNLRQLADDSEERKAEIRNEKGEIVCHLEFRFRFEERFQFELKFDSWHVEDHQERDCFVKLQAERLDRSPYEIILEWWHDIRHRMFSGLVPAAINPLSCLFPMKSLPPLRELGPSYLGASECSLALNSEHQAPTRMVFQGTRRELENSKLNIELYRGSHLFDTFSCLRLATSIHLEDRLEYGHIEGLLEPIGLHTLWCAYPPGGTYQVEGNIGFTEGHVEPKFRQVVVSEGTRAITSSKSEGKFLRVKIIRANRLASLDGFEESLHPFVSVHWNDLTKRSRIAKEGFFPEWNEYLSFQVLNIARFAPLVLHFNIWHRRGFFSNSLLGFKQINVLEIPFEKVSYQDGGGHTNYIFTQKISLDTFGFLESRGKKPPTLEFQLEIHEDLYEKSSLTPQNITSHSFEISPSFTLARVAFQKRILDFQQQSRLQRYYNFIGVDEKTRKCYYLPSFLSKLQIPRELHEQNISSTMNRVFHFVYSIEYYSKSNAINKTSWSDLTNSTIDQLLEMKQENQLEKRDDAIEFAASDPIRFNNKYDPYELGLWTDPYFFLDKGRGDYKDHAILLCSFFIGLGLEDISDSHSASEAFVCLGSVRNASAGTRPHAWVMTFDKIGKTIQPQNIRFWEPSNGFVYKIRPVRIPPYPKVIRRIDQDDDDDIQNDTHPNTARRWPRPPNWGPKSELIPPQPFQVDEELNFFLEHSNQHSFSLYHDGIGGGIEDDNDTYTHQQQSQNQQDIEIDHTLPYLSIDVVFNRHSLWANFAPDTHLHPSQLSYVFPRSSPDRGPPSHWFHFDAPRFKSAKATEEEAKDQLQSFYPSKLINPKVGKEDARKAERAISSLIRDQITSHRETQRKRTLFAELPVSNLLYRRLKIEEFLGWWKAGQRGPGATNTILELERFRREWRDELLYNTLPTGSEVLDKLFFFKHADPAKVASSVMLHCQREIMEIRDNLCPHFAVSVRIQRYPHSVCPVRVLLAVVAFRK